MRGPPGGLLLSLWAKLCRRSVVAVGGLFSQQSQTAPALAFDPTALHNIEPAGWPYIPNIECICAAARLILLPRNSRLVAEPSRGGGGFGWEVEKSKQHLFYLFQSGQNRTFANSSALKLASWLGSKSIGSDASAISRFRLLSLSIIGTCAGLSIFARREAPCWEV